MGGNDVEQAAKSLKTARNHPKMVRNAAIRREYRARAGRFHSTSVRTRYRVELPKWPYDEKNLILQGLEPRQPRGSNRG